MNWQILTSGILVLLTTVGHFTVGSKRYLGPMLDTQFDAVARKVMHCVFHYVSTFLVLAAAGMIIIGLGRVDQPSAKPLVYFIASNFAVFAVWQLALAMTSGIPGGIFKMFQWVFFVLIAGFAIWGASIL